MSSTARRSPATVSCQLAVTMLASRAARKAARGGAREWHARERNKEGRQETRLLSWRQRTPGPCAAASDGAVGERERERCGPALRVSTSCAARGGELRCDADGGARGAGRASPHFGVLAFLIKPGERCGVAPLRRGQRHARARSRARTLCSCARTVCTSPCDALLRVCLPARSQARHVARWLPDTPPRLGNTYRVLFGGPLADVMHFQTTLWQPPLQARESPRRVCRCACCTLS
jgi:hypothetical protein